MIVYTYFLTLKKQQALCNQFCSSLMNVLPILMLETALISSSSTWSEQGIVSALERQEWLNLEAFILTLFPCPLIQIFVE